MSCIIKEISGDLFTAKPTYSLAHCIAADMRMGKGIAVQFKNKFGRLNELQSQKVSPGGVAVLSDKSRFIYNLVTKASSWGKPTYPSLQSSLIAMRTHMRNHSVEQLAMPRIGCGLDGLEWAKVKKILEEVFHEDKVEMIIYNYVPKSTK